LCCGPLIVLGQPEFGVQDSDEEARILREMTRTGNGTDPFSSAVRATRMPMVITDPRQPDNPIVFANKAFSRLTGYEQAAIVGRNCRFLQGPDTDRADIARLRQAIEDRTQIEIELVNYKKDGTRFWNRLLVSPVFDADGELAYFFASQFDVTLERERLVGLERDRDALVAEVAERNAELLDSEARYRTLFDTIDEGFCVIEFIDGPDGPFSDYVHIQANPAYTANAGIPDIVGKRLREIVGAEADQWAETYRQVLQTGTPLRFERKLEATGRYLELAAFRLDHPSERQVAVLFKDVSARRQAEAQLRELNETLEQQVAERTDELRRYHEIVEATESPICAFDTDYRIVAFNKAHNDEFRRVNGFDTKVGEVFFELFPADQQDTMRGLMTRALTGESFTVVEEFGRPEFGQPFWEISYTPLRDTDGRIVGAFHQARDISSRLLAEAELESTQDALRQSQKMDAMGQLTGGVAHDFNNLLTPIIGSLDLLVRKGVGNERERRLIDGALQSAERARTLVQRLLAFARRQPLQPTPVDVSALVASLVGLIESTLGPTIDLRIEVPTNLPPAKADPNQLEMALLNLAVNARDAMPDGGELTIVATRDSVRPPHPLGLKLGHYVRLGVRDTGLGMDEATLRRATEPFFSTKGVGKGTGLGLSMVHGLAAQLGGGLSIASTPGEGSMIDLWLPVSQVAADIADAEQADCVVAAERLGTALLVDDEELVRISTADMLDDLGYTVVEAGSAEEALRLIGDGLIPDVLVTDHLMPGMSGAQLARRLKADRPALPVLIVSGYADVEGVDPDVPRLTKPFRHDELIASLSTLVPELQRYVSS
jgi:PAS domain S-box-containing protein